MEGGTLIHSSSTRDTISAWCGVPLTTPDREYLLPPVPKLPPIEDVKTDIMATRDLLQGQPDLNIMAMIDEGGVKLVSQGILQIGSVPSPTPATVGLTPDGGYLCAVSATNPVTCRVYDCSQLAENLQNINDVTKIYSNVLTLSEYMLSTFKAMSDCWDTVLSEFNKKLFAFHMSLHPGTLSKQFLHLFVTGTASMELENFLVHTLKEKEISKLLSSTLQSYQGIEKLITRQLMSCCYALSTHLQTLLGMSRWYDRYGAVGLSECAVQNSINKLSGLMIKSQELLQSISRSKMRLSAFLKWLLKATISLSDENPTVVKLTEEELKLVVDFLKTESLFATRADTCHFNIDTVWQYFGEDNIITPPDFHNNKLLDTVLTLLKDKKPYLTVQPNMSLLQSHKLFSDSLLQCFELSLPEITTPLHTLAIGALYTLATDCSNVRYVDSSNTVRALSLPDGTHQRPNRRLNVTDTITQLHGYDADYVVETEDSEGRKAVCICMEGEVVRSELPGDVGLVVISESRRLGAVVSALGRRIQILDLEENEDEDDEDEEGEEEGI